MLIREYAAMLWRIVTVVAEEGVSKLLSHGEEVT
jgi:hypothetical protein